MHLDDLKFDYRERIRKAKKYFDSKSINKKKSNAKNIINYLESRIKTVNSVEEVIKQL
jgi:DNA-directed RNA polymerase specialized sigma54-like protein